MSTIPSVSRFDPVAPALRRRFPLDPLRALAAMVVIVTHVHSNQLLTLAHPSAGDIHLNHVLEVFADAAVTLFFVLSAFVLYLPAVRAAIAGRNSTTWKDMLLRRAVRLLPLYFIVVVVVWSATNTSLPGKWQDLFLHLTMLHVYSDRYIFWTDGPAWSLAVEFHFYVLMAIVTPLSAAWAIRADADAPRTDVGVPRSADRCRCGVSALGGAHVSA
ncbi:acyltransferase family protein [Gordonia sp. NPDC003425]